MIPVKFATKMLSKGDADLLFGLLQFILEKLNEQNSPISQEIKDAFEERVLARRLTKVVHLMEYLQTPRFLDQPQDYFKQRIVKSDITKLATSLIRRLFQQHKTLLTKLRLKLLTRNLNQNLIKLEVLANNLRCS